MELEANDEEKRELAYATQFFDFTPVAFIDSIIAPSLDTINAQLDAVKGQCASEFAGKVSDQDLDNAFVIIKDAYSSQASEVLDKYGRYLKKNILCIPAEVVLPEDRAHLHPEGKSYTGTKLEEDLKAFDGQRQEVANLKYRRAVLRDKLANLERVAGRQRQLLQRVQRFSAEKSELDTLVEGQLQQLRDKVQAVRPVLAQLENQGDPASPTRTERKRMLEIEQAILRKRINLENH